MFEYFKHFGQIDSLRLKHGKAQGGRSKNYGFVLFKKPAGLNKALDVGDEHIVNDCLVICKKSLLKDELNELKMEKTTRKKESSGSESKGQKFDQKNDYTFGYTNNQGYNNMGGYYDAKDIRSGGSDGKKTNNIDDGPKNIKNRTSSINVYEGGFDYKNDKNDYNGPQNDKRGNPRYKYQTDTSIAHAEETQETQNTDENGLNDGFRFLTFETMSLAQQKDKQLPDGSLQNDFNKAKSTTIAQKDRQNQKGARRENSYLAGLEDEKDSEPTKKSSEKMPLCREDSSDFFATVRRLTSKKEEDCEEDKERLLSKANLRCAISKPVQGRDKFPTQGFNYKKEARLTATEAIEFDEYIGDSGTIFSQGNISSEKKLIEIKGNDIELPKRSKRRTDWN